MMQCPKCRAEVREVARFCQRCHATLRYLCPSCHHEQRHGGTCEKCGVDFLKYISAVVTSKRTAGDQSDDRIDQRSTFLKNLLLIPLNLGIPLFRSLLSGPKGRGD
jgi:hypothetical protein